MSWPTRRATSSASSPPRRVPGVTDAAVLDLAMDAAALTVALCDIGSVSGDEQRVADAVETALRGLAHLTVDRDGDTVVARTSRGLAERVVLAGHLDTVPVGGHLPCR